MRPRPARARARIRAHLLRWRPRPHAQAAQRVRLACGLRAPPRRWTLLLALTKAPLGLGRRTASPFELLLSAKYTAPTKQMGLFQRPAARVVRATPARTTTPPTTSAAS